MCGAADYLAAQPGFEGPGVGALGFCLGGGLAVWAAATCPNIAAAVTYYYVMPHGKPDFTGISGPVLGHFGTADEFIPARRTPRARVRAAGRRRRDDVPLLRGRRARVLQRHQPPRHLRPGARRAVVGAHGRLPALGARLLSTSGQSRLLPGPSRRARMRAAVGARATARVSSAVVVPIAVAMITAVVVLAFTAGLAGAPACTALSADVMPAPQPGAPWSAPVTLNPCPAGEAARVVFPSDSPSHATGAGRDRVGRLRRLPGRRRRARRRRSAPATNRSHPPCRAPPPGSRSRRVGRSWQAAPPTGRS